MHRIGVGDWLYATAADGTRSSSTAAILVALLVIMGASTLSALSGVGKGIKWLSNINMGLSFFVLAFFLVFGSTLFGLQALFVGLWDYVLSIPRNLFTVWSKDGTAVGDALAAWQGSWSIFYWAWWIAFAPFVGLFLARISRGRTVREYVLGAVIVPSIMCFVWFAIVGGTAIDLELTGRAQGAIAAAGQESQLFAMLGVILGPVLAWVMSIVVVVLLLTYLITSADSAVLIINTINAAGDEGPKARPHILFWGAALALVVGGLIVAGGLGAIKTAMVIGALPFSLVMVLDGHRAGQGHLARQLAREAGNGHHRRRRREIEVVRGERHEHPSAGPGMDGSRYGHGVRRGAGFRHHARAALRAGCDRRRAQRRQVEHPGPSLAVRGRAAERGDEGPAGRDDRQRRRSRCRDGAARALRTLEARPPARRRAKPDARTPGSAARLPEPARCSGRTHLRREPHRRQRHRTAAGGRAGGQADTALTALQSVYPEPRAGKSSTCMTRSAARR